MHISILSDNKNTIHDCPNLLPLRILCEAKSLEGTGSDYGKGRIHEVIMTRRQMSIGSNKRDRRLGRDLPSRKGGGGGGELEDTAMENKTGGHKGAYDNRTKLMMWAVNPCTGRR